MKLHLFLSSCLLSAGLVLLPDPAQANSPVQKILSSEAQGLNNTLRTIIVWAGAGANLNFIPTGEIIKKVWLDDPSQIVLDFDGPMCTSGDHGEDNCENSAATVVHLRRIQEIKFPNLPQTASTLLSVITQTPGGERKLYQFRIAYGSGNPQYHTVAIYPDSQPPTGGTDGLLQAQLQNIELGLRVAKSRNLLGRNQGNQRLELRVQNFLALLSAGATPQVAAQQTGVSLRLISKLASLGTTIAEASPLPTVSSSISMPALSLRKDAVSILPSNDLRQRINDANDAAFGLVVARQTGQITPNSTTWKKVQGAIRQLRLGKSREEAARRSGIEETILDQLIEWGQTRP